ncbi:DUF7059 domain-containing protein [Streptomyces aidingensis]|uniref:Methyltransferase small domain-containing protein n=1 Tax=Streptomyces aidingensis TaxID=910347 RepID=A0A1I1KQT0_9ACTN|nr:class I SAM-dependent methyltransferase [Streptomyces aidingensis]SFC61048.1 Methyltransferase small domain-containing protein [Streptomyces aidingensis]
MTNTELPVAGPDTARLRDALLSASFTADGVLELLGAPAYAALARNETVPALRATRDGSPTAVLIRLFLLQQPVPHGRAAAALPAAVLDAALADGWLRRDGDEVRATADVRPFSGPDGQDWWIVSDLGCAVGGTAGSRGRDPDVVLGVGGASTTLAGITVDGPAARALDIGTGSGIQALHLSRRAARVTATDVNPRALRAARLTLALSGAPGAELRQGSLYEPLRRAGQGAEPERFDLIVSNPPFVISPPAPPAAPAATGGAGRLTYRDGGMAGDELCRALVRGSAAHLTEGGWCQLLANWEHTDGQDWRERVAGWVPAGCEAWIVQREQQDVTEYIELWLRDAGLRPESEEYAVRYDAWLEDFAGRRTRGVGFGWITVRRTGASGAGAVVAEEWPHAVRQPLGRTVREHFARREFLRGHDDAALLQTRFLLADGVVQEQIGEPGAEHPEHLVLRQRHGMMRAMTVDTVAAGLAGSCDGTMTAGTIVDAIARLLDQDPVVLRAAAPDVLRSLVQQGFLLPAGGER